MYSMRSLTLAALAFLVTAGGSRAPEQANTAAAPLEADLVMIDAASLSPGSVQLVTVERAVIPQELQVTGRIGMNEDRTSRVGCVVGGRVVSVAASVGERVDRGQVLAQITSHDVHDARSEYAKAVAQVQRQRSELEFAENARDRAARLYDLKAISLEQFQRAEADLNSARLEVEVAQAEVNRIAEWLAHMGISAEGAVQEYTQPTKRNEPLEEEELIRIIAPIEGTIIMRSVSPGAVVSPADDIFVISNLNTLWVQAEVPERNLASLQVGRSVGIMVRAYPDIVFQGRIALIGTSLNPSTRTVPVRCDVQDPTQRLKPEMYATVRIDLGEGKEGILIPGSAIQDVDGQSTVFVRESEGRYRARRVLLGIQTESGAEVIEGLSPGDVIVTVGSFLLKSELLKRRFTVE